MKMNGTIEYKMPEAMAVNYLKTRKGEDKKLEPQAFLRKVINEEFGIKGECVRVITF